MRNFIAQINLKMPKIKSPNTRLKLIYDFICTGQYPGRKKILNWLNAQGIHVSERTLVNDLKTLRSRKLVKVSGGGRSVEYLPIDRFKELELEKDLLDSDDLFSLRMAITTLGHLKFFTLSKELNTIILKLERELGKNEPLKREFISLQNSYLKIDPGIFQTIFEATTYQKPIEIVYKSFNSTKSKNISFHPYLMKQFNNRWFVIGYREDESTIDHFGVERIAKVRVQYREKFNLDNIVELDDFNNNLFGVSNFKSKVNKIELRFSKHRAPYFISKPPVENISYNIEKGGSIKVSFNCKINKELIAEILSFGNDVVVLKPRSLKDNLKSILQSALSLYD
jgi:predicted DNA-binding transcriptional regulator YafY